MSVTNVTAQQCALVGWFLYAPLEKQCENRRVLSPRPTHSREEKEVIACKSLQEASSIFLHNNLYSELYEKFIRGKEQKVTVTVQVKLKDAERYLAVFTCSSNSDPRAEC